jgi:hypothetical protein
MSSELIAPGTSLAPSEIFALAAGAQAVLFLFNPAVDYIPVGASAKVQIQASSGAWTTINELSCTRAFCTVYGPAVYRVVRRASAEEFGVQKSDATAVPIPVNTVAPAVTGAGTTGTELSCTEGTWTTTEPTEYTYQWRRGGVAIADATGSTYELAEADEGEDITCLVTATNNAGYASQASNTVVGAPAP